MASNMFYPSADQITDNMEPYDLNNYYINLRNDILLGTHPVTEEAACLLGGLQCYIQYGPNKILPPYAMKMLLPPNYRRLKRLRKEILQEYHSVPDFSESKAKDIYIQRVQSLETYDVKFFTVKEKNQFRNKLIPRLFGVSKDAVLSLDIKTNEVKSFPLEMIKKWSCGPNTFTLDLGDYSNEYYSIQTSDGEEIKELISKYIDLKLKTKLSQYHVRSDEGEECVVEEDYSGSSKFSISENAYLVETVSLAKAAVIRTQNGAQNYQTNDVQAPILVIPVHSNQLYSRLKNGTHQVYAVEEENENAGGSKYSTSTDAACSSVQTVSISKAAVIRTQNGAQRYQSADDVNTPIIVNPSVYQFLTPTSTAKKINIMEMLSRQPNLKPKNTAEFKEFYEKVLYCMRMRLKYRNLTGNVCEIMRYLSKSVFHKCALALESNDIEKHTRLKNAGIQLKGLATYLRQQGKPIVWDDLNRFIDLSFTTLSLINNEPDEINTNIIFLKSLMDNIRDKVIILNAKADILTCICDDANHEKKVKGFIRCCVSASFRVRILYHLIIYALTKTYCPRIVISPIQCFAKILLQLKSHCDKPCFRKLIYSIGEVLRALHELLAFIISNTGADDAPEIINRSLILRMTDRLTSSNCATDDPNILNIAYNIVAIHPKSNIKYEKNTKIDCKLIAASKVLADAATKLIKATQKTSSNPNVETRKKYLNCAVETSKMITSFTTDRMSRPENVTKKLPKCLMPSLTANDKMLIAEPNHPVYNQSFDEHELTVTLKENIEREFFSKFPEEVLAEVKSSEVRCLELYHYRQFDTISQLIEKFESELFLEKGTSSDESALNQKAKLIEDEFANAVKDVALSLSLFIDAAAKMVDGKKQ